MEPPSNSGSSAARHPEALRRSDSARQRSTSVGAEKDSDSDNAETMTIKVNVGGLAGEGFAELEMPDDKSMSVGGFWAKITQHRQRDWIPPKFEHALLVVGERNFEVCDVYDKLLLIKDVRKSLNGRDKALSVTISHQP